MTPRKYPQNKLMVAAGIGCLISVVLILVIKGLLPTAGGGWSEPPIYDYLVMFFFSFCFSILGMGYTYYSWKLNEEEYIEWYAVQQIVGASWIKKWSRIYPKGWYIWTNRVITFIGTLIGIVLTGLSLIAIFNFWFG